MGHPLGGRIVLDFVVDWATLDDGSCIASKIGEGDGLRRRR